jgi:Mrp family chromosome partitioning ATPase
MGRMLETLKLGEGRRTPLALSGPVEAAAPVQDCVVDWEIGAEVPFVEVGGPNKKVECSAALLKHPPQANPQPPHLPAEAVAKTSAVRLTAAAPMTASLAPWPAPMPAPVHVAADIIAYHQPEHAASKQFAELLDAMHGTLKTNAAKVLLLCGLRPNVGASNVVLNLAVTAALRLKVRIAILDTRGGLAERLGLARMMGLGEVLTGTLALEQALVKTGIASLHLLPAGKPCALARDAMAWSLGWLRERFDLILVHGPTMADGASVEAHVSHADGMYLVLPQGEAADSAQGIARSIAGMGGRLCGLVHTQFGM